MKQYLTFARTHSSRIIGIGGLLVVVASLLLYKLGSLTHGLSPHEVTASSAVVGWHGIWQHPLYLPLKVVRSVVFTFVPSHGDTLTRLPNALFGGLTILSFMYLIKLWHGTRTSLIAGALFGMSAWTLHISRVATFDVLYLWAIPTLLLIHALLHKRSNRPIVFYGSLGLWGVLLYIPGMVWFVLLGAYLERQAIVSGWQHFSQLWQRGLYVLTGIIWLPLLAVGLTRHGALQQWLGLPAHFGTATHMLKQLVAVPVHLFIRGPQYPELWLARAPLLDVFTLVVCALGLYFYAMHLSAFRSRLLASFFVLSVILVGLGGAVSLSLVVPLLFIGASTGIAYLLHDWMRVFPVNPLARGLGLALIFAAVTVSCVYNLRAYYIAWPHNTTTQAVFHSHR